MARHRGGKGSHGGGGRGGKSKRGGRGNGQWQNAPEYKNEKMEQYYKDQLILTENEWEAHLETCKRPLPTTFRVTGSRENATRVRDYMERVYFPYLTGKSHDGLAIDPPAAIEWYPDNLAYKLNISKSAIRMNPDFKKFQKFLVMETDAGNLVRQEAVSMIPPLLMDIKSDSVMLDMCAAPGSKTSQMVEYLHQDSKWPTGVVIANDSDFKRAYTLTHQVKRMNSPNLVVTNHDATFLANFYNDENKSVQKFDRILADVPCSGDGTLRKNIDMWKSWTVKAGISLHPTQVNCLRRGLQMLKVGGRLVYSTCSLNPIEDEAVLTAVLSSIDGAAHLVDVSAQLPALKRRPGLHTWKATDNDGNYISSIDDVTKDKHRFPTSVFPPTPELAQELHLERAMRIYPHLADTGGFFVAVIDKTAEISGEIVSVRYKAEKTAQASEKRQRSASPLTETMSKKAKSDVEQADIPQVDSEEVAEMAVSSEAQSTPAMAESPLPHEVPQVIGKPKFMKSLNDEYFKFLAPDHPDLKVIFNYFGLSTELGHDCFLTRNISGEPVRSLYYTSPLVKRLLIHNENRVKFVHAGVKVFNRQNVSNMEDGTVAALNMCKWRIAQDGIDMIKDAIDGRKYVHCTLPEFNIFMQHEYPRSSLFPRTESSVITQLNGRPYGCYLLVCDLTENQDSKIPQRFVVPLWKSKVTIQMMLARKDKEAIYTRITGEELPPAVKIDGNTIKELEASVTPSEDAESVMPTSVVVNYGADDEIEAVDSAIADAAAREEEGSAAAVL